MTRTALRGLAAAPTLLLMTALASAAEPAPWPDSFAGRLEALALIESLNADLLSHDSATSPSNAGALIIDWPIRRASSPSG
jgi:hypothetical protein